MVRQVKRRGRRRPIKTLSGILGVLGGAGLLGLGLVKAVECASHLYIEHVFLSPNYELSPEKQAEFNAALGEYESLRTQCLTISKDGMEAYSLEQGIAVPVALEFCGDAMGFTSSPMFHYQFVSDSYDDLGVYVASTLFGDLEAFCKSLNPSDDHEFNFDEGLLVYDEMRRCQNGLDDIDLGIDEDRQQWFVERFCEDPLVLRLEPEERVQKFRTFYADNSGLDHEFRDDIEERCYDKKQEILDRYEQLREYGLMVAKAYTDGYNTPGFDPVEIFNEKYADPKYYGDFFSCEDIVDCITAEIAMQDADLSVVDIPDASVLCKDLADKPAYLSPEEALAIMRFDDQL